jgi:AcrR family transcriptional regulator
MLGTARNTPGQSPRGLQILRAAVDLFVNEGWGAFTARGVARQAGVSLGSVQYLFPTKDLLLQGMLEFVLADYEAIYARVAAELPFNGEQRLLGVVDHLIDDLWRDRTRRFFFNFWALSCHNPFAARLLEETYTHHQRRIAAYVGAARPGLSEQACLDLALSITALVDGMMIYTGPRARAASRAEMSRTARDAVLALLDNHGG